MLVARRELRIREDVELANLSDVGCQRTENEDYFLYAEPADDEDFARRGRLVLVADGMGGCNGGEEASRLAAETVRDVFLRSGSGADPREVLIAGFQSAHEAILQAGRDQPELRGLGTTCSAAILKCGRLYCAHIGDSRIYLIRAGNIQRLTEDHSVVARMVRDGLITEEDAQTHEKRNVLTAALGLESESVAGDFPSESWEVEAGDIILLCTDGLHGLMSDREMVLALEGQSLRDACRELVGRAKVRGGPDNITVQLLKVRSVEAA